MANKEYYLDPIFSIMLHLSLGTFIFSQKKQPHTLVNPQHGILQVKQQQKFTVLLILKLS